MENNVALTHPYHMGKSCSKFGKYLPSGLGDSVSDRLMDGQKNNVAYANSYHRVKSCSKFG